MDLRRLAILKIFFAYLWFVANAFSDVTSTVFGKKNINGVIAAFGDFNSDKYTDMMFIADDGKRALVVLADKEETNEIACYFGKRSITSIVPGDYNGDLLMDLLVTLPVKEDEKESSNILEFRILWGNHTTLDCSWNATDNKMRGQPLVLDYNGDMIPDLYGETEDGVRQVWIMGTAKKVEKIFPIKNASAPIRNPHSNAFLDLNNDNAADIFVTTESKTYEIWINNDGSYEDHPVVKNLNIPDAVHVGQSAFLDIDSDGILDHIVPVCKKDNCSQSVIFLSRGDNWVPISSGFVADGIEWGFYQTSDYPITLRIGDYNLDGYPDLLTVLKTENGSSRAILLENKHCPGCQFSRSFNWSSSSVKKIDNVIVAAFYDIHQDGNLDMLIISKKRNKYKVSAFENEAERDVCFIKVLVVSGLFSDDFSSSNHKIFYGSNQPGPFIRYTTTELDGSSRKGCAAQLAQSAHFSLQLPYTVFGLGQTPNFVDDLEIAIPRSKSKKNPSRSWPSIIPNSQMIIIPLQEGGSSKIKWNYLLFVTPANKFQVLMTVIALIGTCVLVLLIIGGLHWIEKIADKKEKLQEAQRFPFDAM